MSTRFGTLLRSTPWLVAALAATALADARAPHAGGPGSPPPGPPPLEIVLSHHADELGVDESTIDRAFAIAGAARDEAEPLRAVLEAAHDELRALIEAEPVDRDAVLAQVSVVGDAETALHAHRVSTLLAIRDLLTPEQLARLRDLRPQRPGRHQGRTPDGGFADDARGIGRLR